MGKVLWLSNETPDQRGQGGQRRQFFQIRELARAGHAVTVCSLAGPQDHTQVAHHAEVLRTRPRWRGRIPSINHRVLLNSLGREFWDAVVVAHTESWPSFSSVAASTRAQTWVDLHNVLGRDVQDKGTRWANVEGALLQQATAVSVCSDQERVRLISQHPAVRVDVRVMTHGVDPDEWRAPREPASSPVVKLFGNWSWDPNRRGLDWFLSTVWPRVSRKGARCEIAGTGVRDDGLPPDVRFVGRVPRLDTWTRDAWAVVVPVVGGIGAPVKYLEALASRAPVLSTPDGAPIAGDLAVLVSADPDEWVTHLRRLLGPHDAQTGPALPAAYTWRGTTSPLLDWVAAHETREQ